MNWITAMSEVQNMYMAMMDNLSDENIIELYNDYSQTDFHYSGKGNAIIRQFVKRNFDISEISTDPKSLRTLSMNHKVKLIGKKLLSLTISQN